MKYAQEDAPKAILIASAFYTRAHIRQFTVDLHTELVNLATIHVEHRQKFCANSPNYERDVNRRLMKGRISPALSFSTRLVRLLLLNPEHDLIRAGCGVRCVGFSRRLGQNYATGHLHQGGAASPRWCRSSPTVSSGRLSVRGPPRLRRKTRPISPATE
jgi:hypothetical protein